MAIFSAEIGRELKEKLVRIVIFLEGAEELFKKGVEELGLRDEHGEKYIAGVKSLLKSAQHTILSTKTIAQPKHNSCVEDV